MPIFTQKNSSCYFIHIPRTAGRYVTSLFKNTMEMECSNHEIGTNYIRHVDETHLHYPLYEHFLGVDTIPHIAVVRNPYDKFLSCIKLMNNTDNFSYKDHLKCEKTFLKFIHHHIEIHSFHNNWFLPQHKFISPKTSFWKYEWGFGKNFKSWVYEKTKIALNISPVEYEKIEGEDINTDLKLSPITETYVKKFYQKDYELFGYEL